MEGASLEPPRPRRSYRRRRPLSSRRPASAKITIRTSELLTGIDGDIRREVLPVASRGTNYTYIIRDIVFFCGGDQQYYLYFSPHLRRCRYRDGNGGSSAANGGQRLGAGPSHHQQQQQQQPQQHSPGNSGANNGSGGSNNNGGGQQLAAQSAAVAAAAAAAAAALHSASSHHSNPGMVLDLSQVMPALVLLLSTTRPPSLLYMVGGSNAVLLFVANRSILLVRLVRHLPTRRGKVERVCGGVVAAAARVDQSRGPSALISCRLP